MPCRLTVYTHAASNTSAVPHTHTHTNISRARCPRTHTYIFGGTSGRPGEEGCPLSHPAGQGPLAMPSRTHTHTVHTNQSSSSASKPEDLSARQPSKRGCRPGTQKSPPAHHTPPGGKHPLACPPYPASLPASAAAGGGGRHTVVILSFTHSHHVVR